jgi:signal transduction histidine kinase
VLRFTRKAVFDRLRTDSEFSQTVVRYPVGGFVTAYAALFGMDDPIGLGTPLRSFFLPMVLTYYSFAIVLSLSSWLRPGNFWYRRTAAMLADLLALWGFLLLGGPVMLPAYLALVWIIIGNGIRYGFVYLLMAMTGGGLIVINLYFTNPYWTANPAMAATLGGTLAVAPLYALSLMGQLRRANADVQRANGEKSKLLAQASHDMRHPLAALRLFTRQLSNTPLNGDQSILLSKIDLATANANQMLQQFLDRSIIESGILSINKTSFRLADLLVELVVENESWLDAADIDVRIATKKTVVTTDKAVLRTLLQGLISNAVKYAPGCRLLIGARHRKAGLFLELHDDGGLRSPPLDPRDVTITQLPPSAGVGLTLGQHLAQQAGYGLSFEVVANRGFCARIGPLQRASTRESGLTSPMTRATPLSGAHISLDIGDTALHNRVTSLLTSWGCLIQPLSTDQSTLVPVAHICDVVPTITVPYPCILLGAPLLDGHLGRPDIIVVPTTGFSQLRSVLLSRLLEAPAQARG